MLKQAQKKNLAQVTCSCSRLRWSSLRTQFPRASSTSTRLLRSRRGLTGSTLYYFSNHQALSTPTPALVHQHHHILEHHHQLYSNWFSQRNDEEDGEQELVSRGHVFCHLPPRVHSYRVRFYKDFNRVTEKNLTSMFPLPWFLFCVKPWVVTTWMEI